MTSNIFQLDTAAGSFRVAIDGPEDATALVLSNSLGTTLEMWAPQVAALANSYRLIRYDTRGHGGSPITKGPYRFKQLAADVIAILDALHIEQAVFCGVSMGGHTALQLALDAPARLKGIVVCNSAAKIGTQDAWKARADALRQQGQAAIQELAESAPQRWFTPDFIRQHPATVQTMQAQFAALDAEGYAACCDALGQSDLRAELTKIQLPTLIVAGEFDPVTTVLDAEAMKAEIANANLVVLPASHISNVEAAEKFNQALSHFIDSIK